MLQSITNDLEENSEAWLEAASIAKKMVSLEFGIWLDLWTTALNRFNGVNLALQSSSFYLSNAISLLESLHMHR